MKTINNMLLIGNAFLSTDAYYLSMEDIYFYKEIVSSLLVDDFRVSDDFFELHEFFNNNTILGQGVGDYIFANDRNILVKYCRLGLPNGLVRILKKAGELFMQKKKLDVNDKENEEYLNLEKEKYQEALNILAELNPEMANKVAGIEALKRKSNLTLERTNNKQ